jgi:cytochrome c-type biogenesis protein CcmH
MISFVILGVLMALLAIAFIVHPLLRGQAEAAPARQAALVAAILVLATGVGMYLKYGNHGWRASAASAPVSPALSRLLGDTERNPQDLSGWIELARTYEQIQQFPLALRAWQRADEVAEGKNAEALAGIGETLLMIGDASNSDRASTYFERALAIDSKLPKALFFSGLNAYQKGDMKLARERFAGMLALNPPEGVRAALEKQIASIDDSLKPVAADSATAIKLHIALDPALRPRANGATALFVFVRGAAGGPPLAVRRMVANLPVEIVLSATDSMIATNKLQAGQHVQVVARLSKAGTPLPASGDLYGEISYVAGKEPQRELIIDKIQP